MIIDFEQFHYCFSSQQQQEEDEEQQQFMIKQDVSETDVSQPLAISTDDSQDGQITAEVVQADLPSPGKDMFFFFFNYPLNRNIAKLYVFAGGTRRVVLLLPDGSFMMTEVSDEQYQALNLVT